jgi:hypothetical protein
MKRIAFLFAGAAGLALAACGDADDAADDTAMVETETVPAPVVTETTTVVEDLDGDGDSVTLDRNGVRADINDGDTSIEADIGEDPSVTVRD